MGQHQLCTSAVVNRSKKTLNCFCLLVLMCLQPQRVFHSWICLLLAEVRIICTQHKNEVTIKPCHVYYGSDLTWNICVKACLLCREGTCERFAEAWPWKLKRYLQFGGNMMANYCNKHCSSQWVAVQVSWIVTPSGVFDGFVIFCISVVIQTGDWESLLSLVL